MFFFNRILVYDSDYFSSCFYQFPGWPRDVASPASLWGAQQQAGIQEAGWPDAGNTSTGSFPHGGGAALLWDLLQAWIQTETHSAAFPVSHEPELMTIAQGQDIPDPQDPEIDLLGQQPVSDPEWEIHYFTYEDHGLRFGWAQIPWPLKLNLTQPRQFLFIQRKSRAGDKWQPWWSPKLRESKSELLLAMSTKQTLLGHWDCMALVKGPSPLYPSCTLAG